MLIDNHSYKFITKDFVKIKKRAVKTALLEFLNE